MKVWKVNLTKENKLDKTNERSVFEFYFITDKSELYKLIASDNYTHIEIYPTDLDAEQIEQLSLLYKENEE